MPWSNPLHQLSNLLFGSPAGGEQVKSFHSLRSKTLQLGHSFSFVSVSSSSSKTKNSSRRIGDDGLNLNLSRIAYKLRLGSCVCVLVSVCVCVCVFSPWRFSKMPFKRHTSCLRLTIVDVSSLKVAPMHKSFAPVDLLLASALVR